MRVQQILLDEVERALKPYGLTFASYEAQPTLRMWFPTNPDHPALIPSRIRAQCSQKASSENRSFAMRATSAR
jgi:hypothetical protein